MNDRNHHRSSQCIIIVGGGYAGIRLAAMLDGVANVCLVEQRDRFVHSVGSMRAIANPSWLDRLILSYDRLLAHGTIVCGTVTDVRAGSVVLADGRVLYGKYIVLAVGSSYAHPFKPANGATGADYAASVRCIHDRLKAAGSVATVGSGAVGIELAGAIRQRFADKEITLLGSSRRLLPRYRTRLSDALEFKLMSLNITLLLGRRALFR